MSGREKTPEYRAWHDMKCRCFNKKVWSYRYYGGRGITVCERWLHSFDNFLSDMGQKPTPEHSLDRINTDGNYEPGNCRWATRLEQENNKRERVMCKKGFHPLSGENVVFKGHKRCGACYRQWREEYFNAH